MDKKLDRKKLIRELDKYFSLIVREKNKKCFTCGSMQNLTCGHLITRSNYITRWDFDNAETQCVSCNLTHEYRPEIFTNAYIEKYGLEKYQKLVEKSRRSKKYLNFELLDLLDRLKLMYKELQSGH